MLARKLMIIIAAIFGASSLYAAKAPEEFSAVLCKTRESKRSFADTVENCSKQEQDDACFVDTGLADPVECKTFKTEAEQLDFINKNPKRAGLSCRIRATGAVFRTPAVECSKKAQVSECEPGSTKPIECFEFGDKLGRLDAYLASNPMRAIVKCKLPRGQEIELPARSCAKRAQDAACQKRSGFKGEPIECRKAE